MLRAARASFGSPRPQGAAAALRTPPPGLSDAERAVFMAEAGMAPEVISSTWRFRTWTLLGLVKDL